MTKRTDYRIRALTADELVILAKQPADVWLPDAPKAREAEIDRLARTPLSKRSK